MTPLFAIKCFLQSHPFRLLAAAFLGALVLTSYALAIAETPVNPNLAPLSNAVWLVALTMATVGYGDVVPVTTAGQVILVLGGMVTGILLVAALVRLPPLLVARIGVRNSQLTSGLRRLPILQSAALFALLRLDERDKRFIHSLRLQLYSSELKHACARTIQVAWRRFQAFKSGTRSSRKRKLNVLSTVACLP
jgi:hypothetical protein